MDSFTDIYHSTSQAMHNKRMKLCEELHKTQNLKIFRTGRDIQQNTNNLK
jgi:hypothetical protein